MTTDIQARFGDLSAIVAQLHPKPISLSPAEVGFDRDRPTELRPPVQVLAWLHFLVADGVRAVQLPAEVIAHTKRAVHLRGTIDSGWGYTCWVWAGAVTRLHPKPPAKQPGAGGAVGGRQ